MKLVRIDHIRCGEYDGTVTYAWAPDEWSEVQIGDAVRSAQTAYLEAFKAEVNEPQQAPNDYRPYSQPPYAKHPNLTVREVQEEWEQKKRVYEEWAAKKKDSTVPFGMFLEAQGFTHISDYADFDTQLDWGHRHGMRIDYSETKADSFPVPAKAANPEYDPDDAL